MVRSDASGARRTHETTFIGSYDDVADETVILLRDDIDVATVDRLRHHVDDVLGGTTRFITIDARAAGSYDGALLDLVGRIQRHLGRRRGTLRILGLHPALLTNPARDPSADPTSATTAAARTTATASTASRTTPITEVVW